MREGRLKGSHRHVRLRRHGAACLHVQLDAAARVMSPRARVTKTTQRVLGFGGGEHRSVLGKPVQVVTPARGPFCCLSVCLARGQHRPHLSQHGPRTSVWLSHCRCHRHYRVYKPLPPTVVFLFLFLMCLRFSGLPPNLFDFGKQSLYKS